MRIAVVEKRMTSFKFSEATRQMIERIKHARNNKMAVPGWWQKLTNTDVIRQLLQEECKRLDDTDKAQDLAQPIKGKENGTAKKKTVAKKTHNKKGK